MELTEFGELIGDFVSNNHRVIGISEGMEAEIIADDYNGSYEMALKELFSNLGIKREVPRISDIDEYINRVPKENVVFDRTAFMERALEDFFSGKITINELQQQFKKYSDLRDV